MISIGLVVYGNSAKWQQQIAGLKKDLQVTQLLVANNDHQNCRPEEIKGDNSSFEFSAYAQLGSLLEGDGPFVIVNDTLFKTHWQQGWTRLLQKAIARMDRRELVVWGDIRTDGDDIPERPALFLASWIFVLPNRQSLEAFVQILSELCAAKMQEPSSAYAHFLQWWTSPSRRLFGWHGLRTAENLQRKIRSIRLEHALSAALHQKNIPIHSLGHFSPLAYKFLRLFDRLRTRLDSLKSL